MSVKYETLSLLRFVPFDVCMGLSLDLTDGYHHFCLHPAIRPYFNFSFDNKYYECICLPFGWSCSPAVFTRMLRPVVALLRLPKLAAQTFSGLYSGLVASIYLDDLLVLIRKG
jgi:hypothetical protein